MTKHKTGTREEWLAARLDLVKAEKADAAKRPASAAAAGFAVGSNRQGVPLRDRRRKSYADKNVVGIVLTQLTRFDCPKYLACQITT